MQKKDPVELVETALKNAKLARERIPRTSYDQHYQTMSVLSHLPPSHTTLTQNKYNNVTLPDAKDIQIVSPNKDEHLLHLPQEEESESFAGSTNANKVKILSKETEAAKEQVRVTSKDNLKSHEYSKEQNLSSANTGNVISQSKLDELLFSVKLISKPRTKPLQAPFKTDHHVKPKRDLSQPLENRNKQFSSGTQKEKPVPSSSVLRKCQGAISVSKPKDELTNHVSKKLQRSVCAKSRTNELPSKNRQQMQNHRTNKQTVNGASAKSKKQYKSFSTNKTKRHKDKSVVFNEQTNVCVTAEPVDEMDASGDHDAEIVEENVNK